MGVNESLTCTTRDGNRAFYFLSLSDCSFAATRFLQSINGTNNYFIERILLRELSENLSRKRVDDESLIRTTFVGDV